MKHGVVNKVDDDVVEVVTDDGRVERYDRGEFEGMLRDGGESGEGAPAEGATDGGVASEEGKDKGGVANAETEVGGMGDVASEEGGVASAEGGSSEEGASALGRIPKDEKGEPMYGEVDADTAWDAILEQTEGDKGMAKSVVDSMVEDKRKALEKAEKSKAKQGGTISEKIKAEKERQAVIDRAKADLAHWEEIAQTEERRGMGEGKAEAEAKGEVEAKREVEPKVETEPKVEGAKEEVEPKSVPKVEESVPKVEKTEAKEETEPKTEVEPKEDIEPKVEGAKEEKTDDEMRKKERRENIVSNMGDKYSLSDERANNGECFVQNVDGKTNLATIPDEIFNSLGIEPIPFKLTETMAWHVFEHHKKEAKMNSVSDAIDFVLSVVNNVDHVRKGRDNSYIFSIENNRNKLGRRAITIVINSETGDFMGIRTSGYETIKKLEERPLLWERSTLAAPEDVATSTIPTDKPQQGDEAISRTKSQSNVSSDDKDTMKGGDAQGNGGESDKEKGGKVSDKIDAASEIDEDAELKEFQRKYNEGLKVYEEHKAEQAEGLKEVVDDLKREGIDVGEHLADQTKRNIDDDGFFVNGEGGTTVYHGTQKLDLEVEDLNSEHDRVDGEKAGFNGRGVYFTPTDDNDYGNGVGEKILSCKLKISKPFYLVGNLGLEDALRSKRFSDVLLSHGYDAIIVYSSKDNMILNHDPMEMIALRREVIVPIKEKGDEGKGNLIVGSEAVWKHLQKAVGKMKIAWLSGKGKEEAIEGLKRAVGEVDKKEAAACYLFSFYPKGRAEEHEYIRETLRVMREALEENGVEVVEGGKGVKVGDVVRSGGEDGRAEDVSLGEVVFADRGSLTLKNGKRVSRRSVLGYGRVKEEGKTGKWEEKSMMEGKGDEGKVKPVGGEVATDVASKGNGKGEEKATTEGKGEKTEAPKVVKEGEEKKGVEAHEVEGKTAEGGESKGKAEGKAKGEEKKSGEEVKGGAHVEVEEKADGKTKAEGKKGKGEVKDGGEEKEKIDDVGEKIAGARKDWLRDLAKKFENVTMESLVALPFAKAFKRPNLKEAVEKGVLRLRDAHFMEAIMAAFCSKGKPRMLKGWKGRSSEMEIKRWARDVYNGVELMKALMGCDDEATRDKMIEEALSKKVYTDEEIEKRKRELEEWNNGRKFTGTCYPINPLKFFMDVYERLGYGNVGEVKLPFVGVEPATGYGSYNLIGANGKKIYLRSDMTSYEDVVNEAVYLTKLRSGDEDTDHPTSKFMVRGVDPVYVTKGWMVNVVRVKGRKQTVVTKEFGTREEAEKFCEGFKEKNGYVSSPLEVKERTGWGGYEVSFRNDWTDDSVGTGLRYETIEEARAAIDGEHERLNEIVNGKIREEMGAKGEGGKKDYVNVVYYTETNGGGWKYGVVLDEKYAPRKKSAWDTMPYMLAKGFKTREEAEGYIKEHREELDKMVEDVKKRRSEFVYFNGKDSERVGEDYRKGRDVTAEEMREQFGFRGVQFGNWTNQRDRQAAVNNAFDALMDLARVLGVSPRALSLNGELGLAFGARGSGKAAAHYEPEEVVINLTKTSGAGSLAHEWWHALDNYFARRGNVKLGMVTDSKGIGMREELRGAFNGLIDMVEGSGYHKRSMRKGASYWGTRHEETARLFEMWVYDELEKRGECNAFLTSKDPMAEEKYAEMNYGIYKAFAENGGEEVMSYEDFRKTPTALEGYVYPSRGELEMMGLKVRKIFDAIQEKTEEETGNVVMYHRGKVVMGWKSKAERALMDAVIGLQRVMGLRVVTDVDEAEGVLGLLGKGMRRDHRVYHGSGADFDAFDHSHMGEGEGAQAYGWGTYVTEVEGIGRRYAMENANREEISEQRFEEIQGEIADKIEEHYGVKGGIEDVLYSPGGFDMLDVSRDKRVLEKWREYFMKHENEFVDEKSAKSYDLNDEEGMEDFARAVERSIYDKADEIAFGYDEELRGEEERYLYSVEIPDDTGENYLDYTGHPTRGQLEGVRKMLEGDGWDVVLEDDGMVRLERGSNVIVLNERARGMDVYLELKDGLGSDKEASLALAKVGVVGVKYPAEFRSGGREDGKMNYVIFDEGNLRIEDKVRFFRTSDGEVYGFTDGKIIYVDPRVATSETPIHEYGHLWATALRRGNEKEWKNVVGLMKGTKVWDEVREKYPELKGDDEVTEEVIAMYSGRSGAERLREEMKRAMEGDGSLSERAAAVGALGRVKRALEKFWRGVADFLGIHYTSAEEVADRVMMDMLNGVDPRRVGMEERVREQIVGERGTERWDDAERGRERGKNLEVAREMEDEGRDRKAIKMATGWERGRDGKWRYEVEALRAKGGDVEKRWREVVDGKREERERAEKRLEEVKNEIGVLEKRVGELGWKEGGLSDEEERELREGEDRLEELYGEGNDLVNEVEGCKVATLGELCEGSELFKAYPELRDVKVEIGDAKGRIGYYSRERNKIVLSKDRLEEADACLVHEVQHAIQWMEGFEGGGDMKTGERIARERNRLTEMQRMLVDDVRMYDEMMTDDSGREEYPLSAFVRDNIRDGLYEEDFARDLVGMSDGELRAEAERLMEMEDERLDGFEAYRRLAGEVEARNASTRMDMGMDEKRRSLLDETEDVERGKQILLNGEDGGENAMSVGEGYDYEKYPLGRVERGLSEKEVGIVRGEEEHGFKNYGEAKRWAKEHIARTYGSEETGGKGRVRISNTAIDKFLSESAVGKSENKDVHMGVLKVLPDVLKTSVDAETHPDFLKGEDGERGPKNGMNKDVLVHRLYGAVEMGGKMYRVKITLKEDVRNKNLANKAYSYEATKIELLAGTLGKPENVDDAPNTSNSLSAAKLLKGVEKAYEPGKKLLDESEKVGKDGGLYREGDGLTSTEERGRRVEKALRSVHEDWGKGVRDLASSLGVGDKIMVVENGDDVVGATQGMRGAKGWYDPKTGRVVVVLGRHRSVGDVMRTVLHEVVGHYGLRGLVGREGMNGMLDRVFGEMDGETRGRIAREAKGHGWDVRRATEEFLASLAEEGNFEGAKREGVWERVKGIVGDVLRGLGWKRGAWDDNELRYVLWRSYDRLKRGERRGILDRAEDVALQWRLGVGRFRREKPLTVEEKRNVEESVLFREDRERVMARDDYERAVGLFEHKMDFAWKDNMGALRILQESIERNGGGKLREWEDAYMAENRMSSKSMAEMEGYRGSFYKDLIDAVDGLTSGGRTTYEGVVEYMVAKHGLERNVVFARRDARRMAEGEVGKRVRELQKVVNSKRSSAADVKRAEDGIREAEALLVGVKNGLSEAEALDWYDKRKGALDKALGDGRITRGKYDGKLKELNTLYNEGLGEVYFPRFRDRDYSGLTALTGEEDVTDAEAAAWKMVGAFEGENDTMELWRATNAATNASLDKEYECGLLTRGERDYLKGMFDYYVPLQGFDEVTSDEVYGYMDNRNGRMGGVIRRAKGRRSLADDPIATIGNNAARSIMMGNRNDMKMHFLRMVLNHPSDAVSVNKLYLRYDGVKDEWVPQFADIRDGASSDEVKSEVEAFNKKMEGLCKTHPDEYKEAGEKESVPYRLVGANMNEHQVHVKMLGKDYVLTINGNPEAAQALNRLLNPVTTEGMTKWFEQMNHWLAAMYTQKNPAFIFTNLSRDAIFANTMVMVKENKAYRRRFQKNFLKTGWKLIGLMWRYKHGTLDMSEKDDKYYHEFVMNGGQTGYAFQRSVKEYKKMISKELERRHRSKLNPKSWFGILDKGITAVNEWAENVSRFNTYKTSREMGRSIERSIWDAKEITVNFNKRGAGKTVAGKWEEGNRWNYLQAWLSQWCKNGYVFFNAGVQGLSNVMRNVKGHKGKAIGMAATYFAVGMAMPAIMSMLNSMMGGNDDDYYDVPSWVRRNNICIWTGKGYVTIPLPIELRAFYGLGELAYSTMVDKEEGNVAKETLAQLTQVLPIDFMEGGGSWQAFIPSYVKPAVEAYGTNKDWTGRPISKQTPFNENAPEWTKTYKGTNAALTWLAEMSNELSGGTEVEPGDVDWNPAKVQHMLEGYFGGVAKMLSKMYSTVAMPFDESQREWRNVPILSSFYQGTDERTKDRAVKTKFFEYYDEYKKTKDALDKYEKKIEDDDITLRERAKYQVLLNSDKGVRREVMEDFASDIKDLRDEMQTLDDKSEAYKNDERELINIYRQVNRAMKMVDDKFAKKVSDLWSEMDKINAKYEKGDGEEMSEAEEAQREKELEGPRRKLNKLFDEAEEN